MLLRRFSSFQFEQFGFEFFKEGKMDVAVQFDKIGKQDERTFDPLYQEKVFVTSCRHSDAGQ